MDGSCPPCANRGPCAVVGSQPCLPRLPPTHDTHSCPQRLMDDDRLLLLKSCVEDEGVDNKVRHSALRVLLKLIEHRSTAEEMIKNHVLALLAAMLRPKVGLGLGGRLSPL
jgi:hypothetical protein